MNLDRWLGVKQVAKNSDKSPAAKKWKPDYDKTRKETINEELIKKWCDKYKWLEVLYEDGVTIFFCKWCKSSKKQNSLTEGRSNIKADSLTKHEKTDDHQFVMTAASPKVSQDWKKAIKNANSKSQASIIAAMNLVYFQAQEKLATGKFGNLKELCLDLGVDCLKDLNVDEHTNYESYDSIHDMENAISRVLEDKILDKIKKSKWTSILIDESTDVSVIQTVIIYFRLVNNGIVETHFLALLALDGCTAKDIFKTICDFINKHGISYSQISSVGTDGAAVMVGVRNGLVSLLREKCPYLLNVHCLAHRLALASSHAANSIPYLVKLEEILNKLFKYFHYSAKRSRELAIIQKIIEDASERKFVAVFHTRWLSFGRALEAINQNWQSLVSVLLEDKGVVAQGILKAVTSYKFLATISLMGDIMHLLNELSLVFQRSNADFESSIEQINICMASLNEIMEKETGTQFMSFLSMIPKNVEQSFIFKGHIVSDSEKQRNEFVKIKNALKTELMANLNSRLQDIGKVKEMFLFLLPSNIPKSDSEEFIHYGEDKIVILAEHFAGHSQLGSCNNLLREWRLFKRMLNIRCKEKKLHECVKFFAENNLDEMYPLFVSIYEYVACIPMTTVECERGFSVMNLIKTKIRNRLTVEHVSESMIINIEGPERKEFDFNAAFEMWCQKKKRRIVN